MDPANRQRLRKNHVLLKERMDVLLLLDHMFEKDIFTDEESQLVRSKTVTQDRCQEFLETLWRKGNEGYTAFCSVLKKLQPEVLKTIEDTPIDMEIQGEKAQSNIFFDPSDDYELKGLVDDLTKDNSITTDQLERMKNFVIGEPACAEEIIEKIQTPVKFLRHLMRSCLLTRYNLTFLQGLLWRVGNKTLCLEVAHFARTCCQKPVHFYSPPKHAENGYAFGKFHIEGNVEHFKGITIEDICHRVARYLGVPQSHVIPVGVEPSESLVLTLMVPVAALETLKSVGNWTWLADLRIDYILYDGEKIVLKGYQEQIETEHQVLERELKRRMETEQHLKQCLYAEQVSNENLKDIQAELEERLSISEETTKELNTWYMRVFAALLISLHFIAELLKPSRGMLVPAYHHMFHDMYNVQFLDALGKAKRWSSNHGSLMQLVDATKQMERLKYMTNMECIRKVTIVSLEVMQQNLNEAVTTRMTERSLGVFQRKPSLDEVRQLSISFSILCGVLRLQPMLEEVLGNLVNRLDEAQLQKMCSKFNVPLDMQLPDLKSKVIIYIIFSELDKRGKQIATIAETDEIVESCFKEAGRKDLWKEYERVSISMKEQLREQREAQSKKETDITDRLDKMEKMLQTVVGQTMMGNMGVRGGFQGNGVSGNSSTFQDLYGEMFKGNPKFPFQNFAQQAR